MMNKGKNIICETETNQEDVVELLKKEVLEDDQAYHLSEFFKVYSDTTRIKIMHLLENREICVHEIAAALNMSQSAISHQLKILRNYKLVRPRKKGKHVFYSLSDDHIVGILNNGLEHINE